MRCERFLFRYRFLAIISGCFVSRGSVESYAISNDAVIGYGVLCKHKGTLLDEGVPLFPPKILGMALLDAVLHSALVACSHSLQ